MNKTNHLNPRILALTLALLGGITARANTISIPDGVITSGSATWHGQFLVQGSNFIMRGTYGFLSYYREYCDFGCPAPGTYQGFDGAEYGPSEFPPAFDPVGGSFVKDGITYFCASDCGAGIELNYGFTLPDPGASPPQQLVVTTPFVIQAGFGGYDSQGDFVFLNATGKGFATITLNLIPSLGQNVYLVHNVQYDFTPVPEPATIMLAGLGLLTVVLLRRRSINAGGRT